MDPVAHGEHRPFVVDGPRWDGSGTFDMKGGLENARRFLKTTKIFACAESLGGVESLIEHPAIMTHASIPRETREKLGIYSDAGLLGRPDSSIGLITAPDKA